MNLAVLGKHFIEEDWRATFVGKKNGRSPRISQGELAIGLQATVCQNVIFVLRQTKSKLMSDLINSLSCQTEVGRITFEMCNDAVFFCVKIFTAKFI